MIWWMLVLPQTLTLVSVTGLYMYVYCMSKEATMDLIDT
jgi:hypothetical protein